jgi:hypothetical protein
LWEPVKTDPMKNRLILCAAFLLSVCLSFSQVKVSGLVLDPGNAPIAAATVSAGSGFKIVQQAVTGNKGKFTLTLSANATYTLHFSHIGFDTLSLKVKVDEAAIDLGTFHFVSAATELGEVVVKQRRSPVKQKGDTTEFSASAYKTNPDATVEDLVLKMPGISSEGGVVKAQGEEVKKVTIDGRDYFGDDATAALKNLPAEMIEKVQVFDRMSEQSQLTGFDDGNSVKAINIITRADMKNGQFGRLYAGYGSQSRYNSGGNLTWLTGKHKVSLLGLSNNINQQNFASQDIIGISQSAGKKNKAVKIDNTSSGKNAANFSLGPQGGINSAQAGGINYSFTPSKKLDLTASYFVNAGNNSTEETIERNTLLKADSTLRYLEENRSNGKSVNHRLTVKAEYRLDSANTIVFSAKNSAQSGTTDRQYSGLNSFESGEKLNSINSRSMAVKDGFHLNHEVLFKHQFAKKGRSLLVGLSDERSRSAGKSTIDNFSVYRENGFLVEDSANNDIRQSKTSSESSVELSYSEPVGKKAIVMLSFSPEISKEDQTRNTFITDNSLAKIPFLDSSLSSTFRSDFGGHKGGIAYRLGSKENQFSAELKYKSGTLRGSNEMTGLSNSKSFFTVLPDLTWRFRTSAKSSFKFDLHSSADLPSAEKLQDIVNNTEPLFVTRGNQALSQQVSRKLSGKYTFINAANGTSLFASSSVQTIDDLISTASFTAGADSSIGNGLVLRKGAQLSTPVNLNGYTGYKSLATYSLPIRIIRSSLSLTGNVSATKTPGLVNGVLNFSRSKNMGVSASLASNISTGIDFNLTYASDRNATSNSIRPGKINSYTSNLLAFRLNLLSKNGWLLQSDLNYQAFSGLSSGYNQKFTILNMAAGRKFLKKDAGELKLSVADLLRQNSNISRLITETYSEDTRNKVLQQYFLLTFTYRFKAFQAGHQ